MTKLRFWDVSFKKDPSNGWGTTECVVADYLYDDAMDKISELTGRNESDIKLLTVPDGEELNRLDAAITLPGLVFGGSDMVEIK